MDADRSLPAIDLLAAVKATVRIKRVSSTTELAIAFAIRKRVFVIEQSVSEEIEIDGDDKRAVHFLACAGGRAVGTARLVMHQKDCAR